MRFFGRYFIGTAGFVGVKIVWGFGGDILLHNVVGEDTYSIYTKIGGGI